ncbi:MAG: YbhN family protein [Solirubrobacteraceae bacterium]
MGATDTQQMPAELNPRRIRRRMLQLAAVVLVVVLVVVLGPGLGSLRHQLAHASPGWVVAAVAFEVLSALCYVVVFRAVFCPGMSWRLSYQIGMAEQGANSVLSVSGAGGLALGAWALRRGGMSVDHIGRRTVAFFFLTSLANVVGVIVFAALYAGGILGHDPNVVLTYAFGVAAVAATLIVLSLPPLLDRTTVDEAALARRGRIARVARFARESLVLGIRDAVALIRQRSLGVIVGSVGTVAFDIAVLGAAFKAFGYVPPVGVLALGYLIGQLGGNLPIPGGIGGVDGGLIGTFVLYHQPLAISTAAVLIYHAIAIWVPALLGSAAFVKLRRTLQREEKPAAMCMPLAEPVEVKLPARAAA